MVLLILSISLVGFAKEKVQDKAKEPLRVLLETAPILNVKTPIKLKDLKGKIVLVDFWTYG